MVLIPNARAQRVPHTSWHQEASLPGSPWGRPFGALNLILLSFRGTGRTCCLLQSVTMGHLVVTCHLQCKACLWVSVPFLGEP